MKAKLILINLALGLAGLCITYPFWAQMAGALWFIFSLYLFGRADRKGWMDDIKKRMSDDA